jgi:gluconate kinase
MKNSQNKPMNWTCLNCGVISQEKIILFNENLKKHRIGILPILPTCQFCGSEIIFNKNQFNNKHQKIIALTGTCASGKTTTAEMLISKHGFYGIDGDSVMNIVKHKLGITKFEFNGIEMFAEIVNHIDILLSFQKDIVLSHVILPSDIPKYQEIFKSRNLNYKFFLLQPNYASALSRSKTRTCFSGITPEEWVRFFYDELRVLEQLENSDVVVFDNSEYSVEESVDRIFKIFNEE